MFLISHRTRLKLFFVLTLGVTTYLFLLSPSLNVNSSSTSNNKNKRHGSTIVTVDNNKNSPRISACDALLRTTTTDHITVERLVLRMRTCSDARVGNMLSHVYAARLIASIANVPFTYTCESIWTRTLRHLVGLTTVPMMVQIHTTKPEEVTLPQGGGGKNKENYTLQAVCAKCDTVGATGCISPSLDLGVATQIIPSLRQAATSYQKKYHIHSFSIDDAVLHYRCGDAISNGGHTDYGLLPHSAYLQLLTKHNTPIQSISIITQPFHGKHLRDAWAQSRCQIIITDLVHYLHQHMVNGTSIRIRNDPKVDTTQRDYARLTLAKKVAICGPSTYCVWPTISTLGYGYVYRGIGSDWSLTNAWMEGVVDLEMVNTFHCPRLKPTDVYEKTDKELMDWLRQ